MAGYKKRVRDAMVAALSNGTTGFNAALGAIASTYDIPPFALDFGADSANVVYGYLDPEEVEVSRVFEFPGLIMYSTESVDEHALKPAKFSGFVNTYLVFYLRYRELDDIVNSGNMPDHGSNFEKYADAVEDAVNEALYNGRSIMAALGVNYIEYRADRDPIQTLGDGHVQILTLTLGTTVHVQ